MTTYYGITANREILRLGTFSSIQRAQGLADMTSGDQKVAMILTRNQMVALYRDISRTIVEDEASEIAK